MVDPSVVESDLMTLLALSSPSLKEGAAMQCLVAKLEKFGLTVEFDNAGAAIGGEIGNLLVRLPADGANCPPLLLNAHLDTVVPCDEVTPVLEDGVIRPRGETVLGADDKAGVVAWLEVVRCLVEDKVPHGEIELLITVAEEIGLKGALHLDYGRIRSKTGLVFDGGTPIGAIKNAAPSQKNLEVTVHGKAAHAGVRPEEGINAIVLATRAIAGMNLGRLDEETTANVGVIKGGRATNIVPDTVEVRCEARSHDEDKLQRQVEHMESCFREAAEAGGGSAVVNVTPRYRRFRVGEDELPYVVAREAAGRLGLPFEASAGGGGSDANIFNEHGIRSVILNCGEQNPHTLEERVAIADVVKAAEWGLEMVRCYAELAS